MAQPPLLLERLDLHLDWRRHIRHVAVQDVDSICAEAREAPFDAFAHALWRVRVCGGEQDPGRLRLIVVPRLRLKGDLGIHDEAAVGRRGTGPAK